jgi:hypothetical protein
MVCFAQIPSRSKSCRDPLRSVGVGSTPFPMILGKRPYRTELFRNGGSAGSWTVTPLMNHLSPRRMFGSARDGAPRPAAARRRRHEPTEVSRAFVLLILSGHLLQTIDHDRVDFPSPRFELQPELLFECLVDCRSETGVPGDRANVVSRSRQHSIRQR